MNTRKVWLLAAAFWSAVVLPVWAVPAPFAVVELFASEGCSSCPPADDLLRQITADARTNGRPVYTLSFEVDYWDYLGWKDPNSSPRYTARQQQYARAFRTSNVYTPQMVVNGREGFVGSDGRRASREIARSLKNTPENAVTLQAFPSDQAIEVRYQCDRLSPRSVINVALVKRATQSVVTAGENAGRTLHHDNIVRQFKTVPLEALQGSVPMPKPSGDLRDYAVVAYVQSQDTMDILAASAVDLN